ncbi:MAG TPA: PH domain-containing protein, partial [Planctomycetota bacterium]|nr:PH domain-containing protein [Planctomycetota bacterium]
MIYGLLRGPLLALLRAPAGEPEAPAGSHGSVQVFRASPRYLSYRLLVLRLVTGLAVLVALGALLGATAAREPAAVAVVMVAAVLVLGVLVLVGLLVRVDYDLRHYVLTDRSLRVREGAWNVREMTITFANVQNLRIVQGPLMRAFGILHLRVDVAGGGGAQSPEQAASGGHHVDVAGVENARLIRDLILEHLRGLGVGAGLGDPEDERAAAASPASRRALE